MLDYSLHPYKNIVLEDGLSVASFVEDGEKNTHPSTIKAFTSEWIRFGTSSISHIDLPGKQYFDILAESELLPNAKVLDIGCGSGRWSRYVSDKVNSIDALDPSDSIFHSARINRDKKNIRFTQASIDCIPFEDESFDLALCLGVIHHMPNPAEALKKIAAKLKPEGKLLLYVYYNFENRGVTFKFLFALANVLRQIVSVLPDKLKFIICDLIALFVYMPLVFLAKVTRTIAGTETFRRMPLSYYADKSFSTIRVDALDRFGTPLEKRFSKFQLKQMLRDAGFEQVKFSDYEPYWHLTAKKAAAPVKNKMKNILFVAPHRKDRCPSQRFRYEQYLDFLEQQGYDYELSFLLSERDDKEFYKPGNYLFKAGFLFRSVMHRLQDLRRLHEYDLVLIQREAFMTGTSYFEKAYKKRGAKVIYDYDDSIWLENVSEANRKFKWLKDPSKTSKIIASSDLIFAGNQYLADYAAQFNAAVTIVPTTIDTDTYQPILLPENNKVIIGWSGSVTTIQHFKYALGFLNKIHAKYGDRVGFKVIGDPNYLNPELGIQGIKWTSESEVRELCAFDIGIMPLPDDEWAKGKCGLKGLQYMALAIPTIMSPVGVNSTIIQNGENGFLAVEEDEWVEKLSLLIESKELRLKLGNAARQTVLDKYSVLANSQLYLTHIESLIG